MAEPNTSQGWGDPVPAGQPIQAAQTPAQAKEAQSAEEQRLKDKGFIRSFLEDILPQTVAGKMGGSDVVSGVKNIGQGEVSSGLGDLITGGMKATAPITAPESLATLGPLKLIAALTGGTIGEGLGNASSALGVPEGKAKLLGHALGFLGGGAAGHFMPEKLSPPSINTLGGDAAITGATRLLPWYLRPFVRDAIRSAKNSSESAPTSGSMAPKASVPPNTAAAPPLSQQTSFPWAPQANNVAPIQSSAPSQTFVGGGQTQPLPPAPPAIIQRILGASPEQLQGAPPTPLQGAPSTSTSDVLMKILGIGPDTTPQVPQAPAVTPSPVPTPTPVVPPTPKSTSTSVRSYNTIDTELQKAIAARKPDQAKINTLSKELMAHPEFAARTQKLLIKDAINRAKATQTGQ